MFSHSLGTEKSEIERFRSLMIGERKSPYTIKEYTFLVGIFADFVRKKLSQCTPEDVENFKNYLATTKNYSKSSQYLAMKAVKHFFKTMDLPVPKNLTPPRRSRKMPNYLTEREMSILMESAGDDLKTRTILSILANTGIRVGELCNIRVSDLDLDEGIIRIRSGKGDKDRIVVMPASTAELLRGYLKLRNLQNSSAPYLILSRTGKKYDTSSIERMVRRVASRSGIQKRVTPHVLRHTFATAILRNGGDIRFIQQLLGHASLNTTQIYTHVDDNTLKEMYEKHRPRY